MPAYTRMTSLSRELPYDHGTPHVNNDPDIRQYLSILFKDEGSVLPSQVTARKP
jgi:hypothetical protein